MKTSTRCEPGWWARRWWRSRSGLAQASSVPRSSWYLSFMATCGIPGTEDTKCVKMIPGLNTAEIAELEPCSESAP